MSMFLEYNGDVITHRVYCTLTEAMVPKPVEYGMAPECNDGADHFLIRE